MIKLNLATKPGLQTKEASLSKIFPGFDTTIENQTPTPRVIHQTKNLDENIFTPAEKNLDLIEQAEKEEFIPRRTSIPLQKKTDIQFAKPMRVKRKATRIVLYIILIGILAGGYWGYKKEIYKKIDLGKVTSLFTKKGTNKVILDSDQSHAVTDKTSEILDKTQQIGESIVTTLQLAHPSLEDEIAGEYVSQIILGKNRLDMAQKMLQSLPQDAILQYMRVKGNSVTLIAHFKTKEEVDVVNDAIAGDSNFSKTEVFRIETDVSNSVRPIQLSAIIKFKEYSSGGSQAYRFIDDVKISQVVWVAGKKASVSLMPIKIFGAPSPDVRLSEITGTGNIATCLAFFKELMNIYINYGIESISIYRSAGDRSQTAPLDFSLEGSIFPAKL